MLKRGRVEFNFEIECKKSSEHEPLKNKKLTWCYFNGYNVCSIPQQKCQNIKKFINSLISQRDAHKYDKHTNNYFQSHLAADDALDFALKNKGSSVFLILSLSALG